MFDQLQLTVNRNLLKYAAGQNIFCPLCDRILDAKTTVNIQAGEVNRTCCSACFDNELLPKLSQRTLIEADIIDGRSIFRRVR